MTKKSFRSTLSTSLVTPVVVLVDIKITRYYLLTENNIPITTTTQSTLPTTLPTTKPTISPTNGTIPVSKPYCPPLTGTHQTNNFNCPQILYVTRSEWGASSTYGALNDLTQQYSCSKDFIVVHQTLGQKCSNPVDCVERLKTDIQNWKSSKFDDLSN